MAPIRDRGTRRDTGLCPTVVATLHAEGARVYGVQGGPRRQAGTFREPIASPMLDGNAVGRHYAGPNFEHADGSAVVAKVAGRRRGATAKDIPWLKLEVTQQRGSGLLAGVGAVQRITKVGGVAEGACSKAGTLDAPYATDDVFLKK